MVVYDFLRRRNSVRRTGVPDYDQERYMGSQQDYMGPASYAPLAMNADPSEHPAGRARDRTLDPVAMPHDTHGHDEAGMHDMPGRSNGDMARMHS
eukprot:CAMPEP_0179350694 /NCGR_PEP_ID=MMETSP0797-20121207/74888_1 /TAXON_ID=47934 /ORGANISM="Dinophysis acuminata, Strain DAEP01" /LENGTH=94 /DNA_ID=CAMNT_0021065615 /DNA_START=89 /DNA_END=370 /DNA_ORIENTATION=-